MGGGTKPRERHSPGLTRGLKPPRVADLPDHLNLQPVTYKQNVMMQRLEVEADEMSSFVQQKANTQWIWIAMDAITRQVMAFHIGDWSRKRANQVWATIPLVYRQHATFYTEQYVVYEGVSPAAQHRAIDKLARKTNYIARFSNTLRQRVSRLVREALSFAKKLANHIGAIKLVICHDNLTRVVAYSEHYMDSTTSLRRPGRPRPASRRYAQATRDTMSDLRGHCVTVLDSVSGRSNALGRGVRLLAFPFLPS